MAVGAHAYDVDDFIYTRSAKYKVTTANLVKNGNFSEGTNGLDGWTATDAATSSIDDVFAKKADGLAAGKNSVEVQSGANALNQGMYQVIDIAEGGTYIVTLKVKGAEAGYTDVDQFAAGNNYVFAYFNTDGTLSTKGGDNDVTLSYGENGAAIENCYSFSNEEFTEMAFPVKSEVGGKIVIDLRGLASGLEIADVECHKVNDVVDERVATRYLGWIKSILGDFEWTSNYPGYDDLKEYVSALENAIKENGDIETMLSNLKVAFEEEFAPANLSNVFKTINHSAGAGGNFSAYWMDWTNKYNKCSSEALNQPWVFNCDRWAHKTASVNTPLQIQWMRGYAYNNWDPQARLTTTLDKGTYRLGVSGEGGMMTLNKNRWARSTAFDDVKIEMIIENAEDPTKNDTICAGTLSPSFTQSFAGSFTLDEQKEVTILMHCYQVDGISPTPGVDVNLVNPILYKVLVQGEMTPEQKSYLANVQTQIEALEGRIKVAEELVAETQKDKPWGKDNLQKGIDETKKRLEYFKGLDQDALLELCDNGSASYTAQQAMYYVENEYIKKDTTYTDEVLANVIMNAGVRYINNEFINVFNAINVPLTDMPAAIKIAEDALATEMYVSGDKETLAAELKKVKDLYSTQMAAQYSAEGSQALVDAKESLAKAVDAFIASVKMEDVVDIDFAQAYTETPAAEEGEDPTYSIAGTKGKIDILGAFSKDMQKEWTQYAFGQGFNDLYTDVLFFGKGDATVAVDYTAKSNDVVKVSFDIYYGYLIKAKMDFCLLNANGDTIAAYSRNCDGASALNTLNIDESKFSCIGGRNNGNVQGNICVEKNRTHFDIYLNYTDQKIFATTSYNGTTNVNDAVAMPEGDAILKKILFSSTYSNGERNCWLDNVKVSVINDVPAAGSATGISEVATSVKASAPVKAIENGQLVIKSGNATYNAVGVQVK